MSHSPVRIGRAQRGFRDDRVFLVATEDTYAPKQYFEGLSMLRVKVIVLPTPQDDTRSSQYSVVERLKTAFEDNADNIQEDDEFWVLLDTDHWIQGSHRKNLLPALRRARQMKFEVAMSNPCFELWLLLHHTELEKGKAFGKCEEVEARLNQILGGYDKTSIHANDFTLTRIPEAIKRARALEDDPDILEERWPRFAGTRIYRLFESIFKLA